MRGPVQFAEIVTGGVERLFASLADPQQLVANTAALIAGVLILVSALVRTIIPLRWLALGSNLGFVVYGIAHPAPIMLLLHAALLPINLVRGLQMMRLTRVVRRASDSREHSAAWLQPYMKTRRLRAGHVLFRKGDEADHLYFLAAGQIEFVELGRTLDAGHLFGEIAFFAPDRRRTSTARCLTASRVLRIDEATLKQLYYQNPEFGFELVRLVAARLSEDVRRLEQKLVTPTPQPNPPHEGPP
jgi:CRP/FNR family transcriptional regulator, cyclic AMP receptor protein